MDIKSNTWLELHLRLVFDIHCIRHSIISPLDSQNILLFTLFYEQASTIKEPKTRDLDILQYKQKFENLQHYTRLISVVGSYLQLTFQFVPKRKIYPSHWIYS